MPDAGGNIKGIALNGRAAEAWERIFGDPHCQRCCSQEQLIGFTACWKTVEGEPGNCRKPKGHEGDCAPY